jgi:spermidine/putrescine transport system ATP-binding protein
VEGGLDFLANPTGNPVPGAKVTLAIRPEKILLKSGGSTGTIAQTVYVGTDTNYEVRLTDSLRLNVRVQNAMDGRAQFAVGDKVGIDVPAGAARMLVD